jgi:tetratricopeptide (TPR) repeat protein
VPILFFLLLASNAPTPLFREVPASESGITWTHQNGRSEHRYLPETSGAGVAIFDYNNDGWTDILLANSGPSSFYKPGIPLLSALYRNNRDGTFTGVAKEAGITTEVYGMGVATGDYDGDGTVVAYRRLAQVLDTMGGSEQLEALHASRRALALRPGDPVIELRTAVILTHLGRYAAARPLLEHVVKRDPHNSQAHVTLATTYSHLGERALARKETEIVVELEKSKPERTQDSGLPSLPAQP